MKNNYDSTVQKLEAAGWTYDHTATVNNYRYSGTVSPMKTRGALEFCRVHTGKTYNVKTIDYSNGARWIMVQITLVFRRCKA